MVDCSTATVVAQVQVRSHPFGICYLPSTGRIYCSDSGSSTVSVIDCGTNTLQSTLPVGDEPVALAWDNDRFRLYVANQASSEITVILDSALAVVADTPTSAAQPVRGAVFAGTTLRLHGKPPSGLFDEAGCLVQRLRLGDTDIRSLAPGVYFVIPSGPAPGRSRKLLIAR